MLDKLGQLCVPLCKYMHTLIWDAHYKKKTSNFGVENTLTLLYKYLYCLSHKIDVDKYIKSCVVCDIIKPLNQWKWLCTPFPIIIQPWESISLDYLTRYPITEKQHDTILVMVDRFPKRVFLIPCKNTGTTQYSV